MNAMANTDRNQQHTAMRTSGENDELFPGWPEASALPSNVDRRSFLIRNAVIGAAAAMTGSTWTLEARAQQAAKEAAAPNWGPPSLPT